MILNLLLWFRKANLYKRWILLTLILVSAYPLYSLQNLNFSLNYEDFFGGSDAHFKEYIRQQNTYSKSDNILIAINPSTENVFNHEVLNTLRRYTHESWLLPNVTRVDSITNFQDSLATSNEILVRDLYSGAKNFEEKLLTYVKQVALSEPALVNRLISADGRFSGIALTVNLPDDESKNQKIMDLVKRVRTLSEDLRSEPTIDNVYLSGTVMINNAFYEAAANDALYLIPMMFLIIVVVTALLFRSVTISIIIFFKVGLSVGIAFGVGAIFGIDLTPPSVAAAPILMMLSIADSVHILSTYMTYLKKCGDRASKFEAMMYSLSHNFKAITLTSLTTLVGFLAMNTSSSPPFHDLGNIVAVGVLAGYVLTILGVCLIVPQTNHAIHIGHDFISKYLESSVEFVLKRPAVIGLAFLLVGCGLGAAIFKNELNDEFVKYFDESIQFRTDNDFITTNLTGIYQIQYSLKSDPDASIHEPEYLRALDRFAGWFRDQPNVMHVESVADIYKKANMNLNDGISSEYKLPATSSLAAQAMLAYELSLPNGRDLNDKIDPSKTESKFIVSLATISANTLLDIERNADAWLRDHAPQYMLGSVATGPALLFSRIGMRSIQVGLIMGGSILVFACLLIAIIYQSPKLGIVSIVPNVFPAIFAFGCWGVFYGKINMALATVLSMTLGIIIDDTIHFLDKFMKARNAGIETLPAIKEAYVGVGKAIVLTTLILVSGFLVLTMSPFLMNWGMGLLSSIVLVFALLTDLYLLPIAIAFAFREKHNEG